MIALGLVLKGLKKKVSFLVFKMVAGIKALKIR